MTDEQILAFLRCPDKAIVDLAVEMANLTWKEELAVTECGRKYKTQEKAAEDNGRSPDAMQRWYRSGMKKLSVAWSGCWWVKALADKAMKMKQGTE